MRALLDTHAFLWWIADSPSLSKRAREVVADPANEIYLSSVSVWEIAIKARAGRLNFFSGDLAHFIVQQVSQNQFHSLPVTLSHSAKIHTLSQDHRDPFDQMLAAQSLLENMPILSVDPKLHSFGVEVIW
ncbi:MAG: type II toxin-antitoxin system VapC family toxin [Verrucomicrobia bacterium]|nr:type II toxin-antitoxin system VapC family toxin [Verrucomicrobiota bacterium]